MKKEKEKKKKITATESFQAFNRNMRVLGFDTAQRCEMLFNWTIKELNDFSDAELAMLNHRLFEETEKIDCSHKKMFETVRVRVNNIRYKRMENEHERRIKKKRESIEKERALNGAMACKRVEKVISEGSTTVRISTRQGR